MSRQTSALEAPLEDAGVFHDTQTIEIEPQQRYLVLRAGDTREALIEVACRLAQHRDAAIEDCYSTLAEDYQVFADRLAAIFVKTFGDDFNIHTYQAEQLARSCAGMISRDYADQPVSVLSLDKLFSIRGGTDFLTSRIFAPAGRHKIRQAEAPGADEIELQIERIVHACVIKQNGQPAGWNPLVLFEDDYFNGGTIASIGHLVAEAGKRLYPDLPELTIDRIYATIQVGDPQANKLPYPMTGGVRYRGKKSDQNVMEQVELLDIRDFLLGASGLVVDEAHGPSRLPYLHPFVDPESRASIPAEDSHLFSREVLKLNLWFFERHPEITLSDVESGFAKTVIRQSRRTLSMRSSMADATRFLLDHIESLWQETLEDEHSHLSIEQLLSDRPKITLDFNGTLDQGDLDDKAYQAKVSELAETIQKLQEQGYDVGMLSDSPIMALQELSKHMEIEFDFLLAENGNTLHANSRTESLRTLPQIDELRETVNAVAQSMQLQLYGDDGGIQAPEFTGETLRPDQYAFSIGRKGTLAVYCGQEGEGNLAERLIETFTSSTLHMDAGGVTTGDGYGYFSLQPRSLERRKGEVLEEIARIKGCQMIHIGDNPINDWSHGNGTETRLTHNAWRYHQRAVDRGDASAASRLLARLNQTKVADLAGISGTISLLKDLLNSVPKS